MHSFFFYMFLPLRRYFEFSGRSRRKEYWLFFLFCFVVSILLDFLSTWLSDMSLKAAYSDESEITVYDTPNLLFFVFTFIPSMALYARRAQDFGLNGWIAVVIMTVVYTLPFGAMVLIDAFGFSFVMNAFVKSFASMIVSIILFIMTVSFFPSFFFILGLMPSTKGDNRFGKNPLPADG